MKTGKMLYYKGRYGSVNVDLDTTTLYGRLYCTDAVSTYEGQAVIDLNAKTISGRLYYTDALVTYEGQNLEELRQAFRDAVDDFDDFCKTTGLNHD